MTALPPHLVPASQLRLICFPSVCVALDVETGALLLLSGEAARLISHLERAGGATSVLSSSARERAVAALVNSGVLAGGEESEAWDRVRPGIPSSSSWGTRESPAALAPIPRSSPRWYALGACALLLVLGGGVLGRTRAFARTRRLVGRTAMGPPEPAAAEAAAYAVRRIGRLLPLRVACWEEAAATTVALHWAGYQAVFRHGAATDPVRLHAWVEVGGRPVAEADDITDYTSFEESCE
ncbi:lasso peptide biosynthesis B2 protein [Nocardiopsis changdeensis]|uniref:lasso peptide biosynthesis B2 protein n=1 Tax=Nocardiopsis changdeensis TaxID=2831969 RepID=UPI003F4596B7